MCIIVGLARTIYIRCTYDIFGLEITKYTANIRCVYMYIYGSGQPYVIAVCGIAVCVIAV